MCVVVLFPFFLFEFSIFHLKKKQFLLLTLVYSSGLFPIFCYYSRMCVVVLFPFFYLYGSSYKGRHRGRSPTSGGEQHHSFAGKRERATMIVHMQDLLEIIT